jgi:hypothetical protein
VKGKKVEEVSLGGFLRYMYEHLRVTYEAITDSSRKNAVISKDTVANALVGATALGARSLREADFWGRSPVMRQILGGRASDTTFSRVAAGFQGTAQVLRRLWRRLRHQGHLGLEGQHIAVIDGTSLGGHLTSVVAEIGEIPAVIATEHIDHTGKELCVSLELLERLSQEEGRFCDYLLGDGLYPCERFWKVCDRIGCKGLVKTNDTEVFAVILEARMLFDYPVRGQGIGYQLAQGFDVARACQWRVWQTTALWADTRRRLTVARVEETFLKGKRSSEVFWVLSQDLNIAPEKLLKLMHARWFIENNVFKAFNDQAHSKHQFSRTPQTAQTFTHLQALAFMALAAYRLFLERTKEIAPQLWDHGRIPLRLLQSVFRLVLSPVNSS